MQLKRLLAVVFAGLLCHVGWAQDRPAARRTNARWRPPQITEGAVPRTLDLVSADASPQTVVPVDHTEPQTASTLPNDHGQVWKEYDIRGYTARTTDQPKAEQAIVDWILRETGTEAWFSEPLGLLSANPQVLRVYHTAEMQTVVSDIVNRFVRPDTEKFVFGVRMVTVANPNWRTKSLPRLQPVHVESPGVEAWLMSREDAAIVYDDLRKRTDFREHNSPNLLIRNGQSHEITRLRPLAYVKAIRPTVGTAGGHHMEMGQIEEGFSLTLSPLLATDQRSVDAVIKVETSQVERLTPIRVQAPSLSNPRQTAQVQVPQSSSWRLHERFRWPADQILLISCGVVATPGPDRTAAAGLPNLLGNRAPRADALLFVEAKGRLNDVVASPKHQPQSAGLNYRGRY